MVNNGWALRRSTRVTALLMLLLSLATLAHIVYAEVVPLEWTDSGEDIVPGYVYPVVIHAEYQRAPFQGYYAVPAMQAGPLMIKVDAEFPPWLILGGVQFRTRIYVDDQLVWESEPEGCSIACGRYEYELVLILDCDCEGNCVVRRQDTGQELARFTITHPVRIFYENSVVRIGLLDVLEGWIRVERPSRSYICDPNSENYNTIDYSNVNLPGTNDWMEALQQALSDMGGFIAWVAGATIVVFMLGLVGITLLMIYTIASRQARRRRLI